MVPALWWSHHRSCGRARLLLVGLSSRDSCRFPFLRGTALLFPALFRPALQFPSMYAACVADDLAVRRVRCLPGDAWMPALVCRGTVVESRTESRCATRQTRGASAANANGGAAHENEEENVFGGCGPDPGGRQCGLRSVLPGLRDGYVRVDRCGEGVIGYTPSAVEDRELFTPKIRTSAGLPSPNGEATARRFRQAGTPHRSISISTLRLRI